MKLLGHCLLLVTLVFLVEPAAATSCMDGRSDCLTNSQAVAKLSAAGISVRSSGSCSTRSNRRCTSLQQIKKKAIDAVIVLKRASKCSVVVTGGTEVGHSSGTYSHYNGWKIDVAMSTCLTNYITSSFRKKSNSVYCAASGNKYYNENNHWDINYGSGC